MTKAEEEVVERLRQVTMQRLHAAEMESTADSYEIRPIMDSDHDDEDDEVQWVRTA